METPKHLRGGQSLVELLVAIAIGVILIAGAVAIISPALDTHRGVQGAKVAGALGKELLENVRVFGEADWHAIDALSTTSANQYYIIASTSPFTATSGIESVVVATTTYTRYFYLDDVYRNVSGNVLNDTSGSYDPSTKKVTVMFAWPPVASGTISTYVTRAQGQLFIQSNWSGGGNQDGPVTATTSNNTFSTSSNIDYTTTTGSIRILGI